MRGSSLGVSGCAGQETRTTAGQETGAQRGLADVAAALDLVLAAGDAGNGLRVGLMLFDQDAVGERVGVVGFEHRNDPLQDDDAVIQMLVDEVHRAAGDLHAVVEGLGLRLEAGEGGQQRRMNVEDAVGEGVDEFRREQAHVAGQADQIHVVRAQGGRACRGRARRGGGLSRRGRRF